MGTLTLASDVRLAIHEPIVMVFEGCVNDPRKLSHAGAVLPFELSDWMTDACLHDPFATATLV